MSPKALQLSEIKDLFLCTLGLWAARRSAVACASKLSRAPAAAAGAGSEKRG